MGSDQRRSRLALQLPIVISAFIHHPFAFPVGYYNNFYHDLYTKMVAGRADDEEEAKKRTAEMAAARHTVSYMKSEDRHQPFATH